MKLSKIRLSYSRSVANRTQNYSLSIEVAVDQSVNDVEELYNELHVHVRDAVHHQIKKDRALAEQRRDERLKVEEPI